MSNKAKAIWNLYRHGRLTKEQVKAAVPGIITQEEYRKIVGESPEQT